MTPESLLADGPPPCLSARCCVCGRETTAPVEVRHIPPATTLYVCPRHATALTPGPVADEERALRALGAGVCTRSGGEGRKAP
ncbi:hypothetical protein ACWDR0_06265 [Streptomyces sp. NPDC003691]